MADLMANARKNLDEIQKPLSNSLEDLYSKYEGFTRDESNILHENFKANVTATENAKANSSQTNMKISINDVTSDPVAQKLICRMKSIIQTPGYMKLFKRITYELRSDMDHIVMKIVKNHMSEDSPTKNAEHLKLHELVYEEKIRLRKYCGSIVVDDYYEYLAMEYHLLIKLGINNSLMNALLIAKESNEQSQTEKKSLQ